LLAGSKTQNLPEGAYDTRTAEMQNQPDNRSDQNRLQRSRHVLADQHNEFIELHDASDVTLSGSRLNSAAWDGRSAFQPG
jgi:hypothetical protein